MMATRRTVLRHMLLAAGLRRYRRQFAYASAVCIGGEIGRITVTRDGTLSHAIHRWPDRIGEKIRSDHEVIDPAERRSVADASPVAEAMAMMRGS